MKYGKLALFTLLCASLVLAGGCTAKKGKGGKKGPQPTDEVWDAAFANAISIGASAALDESAGANDIKPDDATPFIQMLDQATIIPAFSVDEWEVSYTYKYSVTVGGEDKNAQDYIEQTFRNESMNVTAMQFKNWPSGDETDENPWPLFKVEATAKCNGYSESKNYIMRLNKASYSFRRVTLQELYTKHDSLNALKYMKEDTTNVYKYDTGDPNSNFFNVETQGKLVYVTEDANWGIIQDGAYYMQVYRLDLLPIYSVMKSFVLGQNIWLQGALGFGYGNLQLSYIKTMLPVASGDSVHAVQEPAAQKAFTESDFSNTAWYTNPLFNIVGTISGATVKDGKVYTVKNASGGSTTTRTEVKDKSTIASEGSRYEFDVLVGGTTLIVATDYHANCNIDGKGHANDSSETFTNWLKGLTAGQQIKLGGTARWLNDRTASGGNDYSIHAAGSWTIVPYLVDFIQ